MAEHRRMFADLWQMAEKLRGMRGQRYGGETVEWPGWCYLPTPVALAAIKRALAGLVPRGEEMMPDEEAFERHSYGEHGPVLLSALAAWRTTKGVYRFDGDVFGAVWETPLTGEIPVEVLYRLPEWCCYVEIPEGFEPPQRDVSSFGALQGFFVFLDYNWEEDGARLTFILDRAPADGYEALLGDRWLKLSERTLEGCVAATIVEGMKVLQERGSVEKVKRTRGDLEDEGAALAHELEPLVSVVLYLCSTAAEIAPADGGDRSPGNPEPTRRKKREEKILAAQSVTEWNAAWRLGAALRRARKEANTAPGSSGAGPRVRPHIRRAHYHSYWTGPRDSERLDERKLVLKWLPPIPVNVGDDGDEDRLPAVVRPVE